MVRVVTAAIAVAVALPAHAEVFEVGGSFARVSSTIIQTSECPSVLSGFCLSNNEADERRYGSAAGVFVRYALARPLLVQAELLYSQKGYEYTPTLHIDYLELPIAMRFDPLRRKSPVRLFVVGGVAPALRVHCREAGRHFEGWYDVACDQDPGFTHFVGRKPSRFDLAFVLGAGFGWATPVGLIEIQWRSSWGVIDIEAGGSGIRATSEARSVAVSYAHEWSAF